MTVIAAALLLAIAVQTGGEASAPANALEARCRQWLALRLRIEASGARPETYANGLAKLLLGGDPRLDASGATASAPEPGGPFEPVAEQFCREVGHLLDDSAAIHAADLDDGEVESIATLVSTVAARTPEPRRAALVAEWRVRKLECSTRIALQRLEGGVEQAPEQFKETLQHLVECAVEICSDVKTAGHEAPSLASRGAASASHVLTAAKLSQHAAELLESADGPPTLRAKLFETCFELLHDQPSAIDVTAGALLALAQSTLRHASTASLHELCWLSTQASSDVRSRFDQGVGKNDPGSYASLWIDVADRGDDWAVRLATPGVIEPSKLVTINRVRDVAVLHDNRWLLLALTDEQLRGRATLPLLPSCRLRVRFDCSSSAGSADSIEALVVCEKSSAKLRLEIPSRIPRGYCAVLLSSREDRLHLVARDGWSREQFAVYANRWLGDDVIGSTPQSAMKAIAKLLEMAISGDSSNDGAAIATQKERSTALATLQGQGAAARMRFAAPVTDSDTGLLAALKDQRCKLVPITTSVFEALVSTGADGTDPLIAEWSKSTHLGETSVITAPDGGGTAIPWSRSSAPDKTPPRFLFVDQINYTIGTPADRER